MSAIVIVDTSVLLNILDVPGRNEGKSQVLVELSQMIDACDHLFIPMAAIVEAGNHIAQIRNGRHRRSAAERLITEVRKAMADEVPWKPINFPSNQAVLCWLDAFPDAAMQGLGMGDLSIKKEWEDLCVKYPMTRVRVWTLDEDLAGLDRTAGPRH
ncbi:MAG TPA: type II toxin-antitoxin system VapC family toxin [Burkholderiaceae bacterium]